MIDRHFLGWEGPALAAATDFLVARYENGSCIDLQGVIVVVPGARAGRRLVERLVRSSEERAHALVPPRVMTAGALPQQLFTPERPLAGNLLQLFAWCATLQDAAPEIVETVVPRRPESDNAAAWISLAEVLQRLHRELAHEGVEVGAVVERATSLENFHDAPRWHALQSLAEGYLRKLAGIGQDDPEQAFLEAVRQKRCSVSDDIVLLGVSDLGGVLAEALEDLASGDGNNRVTALVFAPLSQAERFDALGCVRSPAWQDAVIEVAPEQMVIADTPADQAAAVVHTLSSYGGKFSAEEITIGAPDSEVTPYIEQQLRRLGIPSHRASAAPLSESPPGRLLDALEEYLAGQEFKAFGRLLRHPDVESWLASIPDPSRDHEPSKEPSGERGWLHEVDLYATEHLPHRITEEFLGNSTRQQALQQTLGEIEDLVGGLSGAPRPLHEWAAPILDVLAAVYTPPPRSSDRPVKTVAEERSRPGARVVEWLTAMFPAFDELHKLDQRLSPIVDAAQALHLLRAMTARVPVPTPVADGAIEILGWLELPLDDAPALVVTGFNDGTVPGSVSAEPFLNNSLRRTLGLVDNERRRARDAYALSALLASRREVTLVAGRRAANSTPLAPSRLLFACAREDLPARVDRLLSEPTSTFKVITTTEHNTSDRFAVPEPETLKKPISSMSITAFRDYLSCPYGFYLRRILKLNPVPAQFDEMSPLAFGNLTHDILNDFGKSPAAESTDSRAIASGLDQLLATALRRQFGKTPKPAVLVQAEQLRTKLHAFAEWQASWRSAGWRIQHVEVEVEPGFNAFIGTGDDPEQPGEPMYLRGRIDRIDLNEESGEYAILDYKTSEAGEPPEKTHQRNGEWVDLQLPLYRHLAPSLGVPRTAHLGYIVLPKDVADVGERLASWDGAALRSADEKARWVVEQVRNEVFWPPTTPMARSFSDYSRIYQDSQLPVSNEP